MRLPNVCTLLTLAALLAIFAGCDSGGSNESPEPEPPDLPFALSDDGFTGEVIAEDLDLPTSIAFPPDGSDRLFINELQSGRILIVENGELQEEPFAQLETNVDGGFPVDGENGLIGLAFDPDYTQNGYVYVTYAARTGEETLGTVARFTDTGNQGEDFTVLLDSIPSAPGHQIESLAFGLDGKLYVSTGDAYNGDAAQDTSALEGKILRMNPDGSLPEDNPFPDAYTYALGFRNCFDLVFDDEGRLFTTDNGPEFGDELNLVVEGSNYGWPKWTGAASEPGYEDPLYTWNNVVAPTGMLFYEGEQFPTSYHDRLFVVLFGGTASTEPSDRAKRVQVAEGLDSGDPSFEDFLVYDQPGEGNPLDITEGPDGSLYFSDIFQGRVFKISFGN